MTIWSDIHHNLHIKNTSIDELDNLGFILSDESKNGAREYILYRHKTKMIKKTILGRVPCLARDSERIRTIVRSPRVVDNEILDAYLQLKLASL